MNRFYLRIILPAILSILLFILAIFLIIIPHFQQNIMDGKRAMIKELTNSALSILSKYENDEKKGLLTPEEAKKIAASRIQYLRYGEDNKDYFWITDLHPIMIMHPYRSDLNGKDLSNTSDPHGKKLFVEFVRTVRKSDHGYVEYMWQWKDDSLHIVPKLSYVSIFKPWGWVIGTGIYIEDVKKEISALTGKLLWISVGISFVIALLLMFISQQSLIIERKRIGAEKELHQSREKYRTLVEAATEGLIMLIDGKISLLNTTISKMTGYDQAELLNLSINELLSENNNKDIIETFSRGVVREGQYELYLKKKAGGVLEVLVTSSTAKLYNTLTNIIIVKDITIDRTSDISALDYRKLVGSLDIGIFRAEVESNGRFLFANETALRIMGADTFGSLAGNHFLNLLTNPDERKSLRNMLHETGFARNRVVEIKRINGAYAMANITLVVFNDETSDKIICDGVIEDVTAQHTERNDINGLIADLKSGIFLMEQPVGGFITQHLSLGPDATIYDAIQTLSKRKADCVLAAKSPKEFIGIITNSDIQKRVLALDLKPDNPAYLIMSSPIVSISEGSSVCDAVNMCEEKSIHHLVVKNAAGDVAGVFNLNAVFRVMKDSLSFFVRTVSRAETNDELKYLYRKLQFLIKPLIQSGISVKHITNITSGFSDAVTKRIIELTVREIGAPPVRFSFISLGSVGRREETLLTDQDNAIIYEDVPADKEPSVNAYFQELSERVCDALDEIGYCFCRGNIMAKNQQWCQPMSVWEKYFSDWISTPEPANLLDATIFFDFRNIYGDEDYTIKLQRTIDGLIRDNSVFLYHLAHNTHSVRPPQISSGHIIAEKNTETIDLKNATNLIVMFVRTYALRNSIRSSNTIDRLHALKTMHILHAEAADEILYVYNYLMRLRLKNQTDLADKNFPLSNTLQIKKLLDVELSILKKVLSLLPAYQNKISMDFRLAT